MKVMEPLSEDADFEQLMAALCESISTEPQKSGARRRSHGGKTRGGLSTKINAAVDALGNPVRLLLTPGPASEYGQAEALLDGFTPDRVLADKGYDSDALIAAFQRTGANAVIPSRRNRQHPRPLDLHSYKGRNLVERIFLKLKQFRRIATRYERLARSYLSMLSLVSAVIWLA
nr:IS5 family transposase [Marinobacterium rhizophilum]